MWSQWYSVNHLDAAPASLLHELGDRRPGLDGSKPRFSPDWCGAFRSWRLARFNAGNEQTHLHVVVAVQQEVNDLLRCT
jgi:hypothetical protein